MCGAGQPRYGPGGVHRLGPRVTSSPPEQAQQAAQTESWKHADRLSRGLSHHGAMTDSGRRRPAGRSAMLPVGLGGCLLSWAVGRCLLRQFSIILWTLKEADPTVCLKLCAHRIMREWGSERVSGSEGWLRVRGRTRKRARTNSHAVSPAVAPAPGEPRHRGYFVCRHTWLAASAGFPAEACLRCHGSSDPPTPIITPPFRPPGMRAFVNGCQSIQKFNETDPLQSFTAL